MTVAGALLGVALGLPLAMLLACLSPRLKARMPALLALAPVPALAAALLASGGMLELPPVLLGLSLALDVPGAMLLGVAAVLWIAAGLYATAWLRGRTDGGRFALWWLLTLTGSIGVFMAADLVSFYLVFSLVSLAAYGLIVDDGTPRARRYGLIYVALAVLGEAFLLMAFVLLAQAARDGSLLIRDAVAALPASPWRDASLALLILGFGVKIGLVPFHVWMPLAYRAAPIPAAAVLSGAAVKAGVIGLIRFLPLGAALSGWGEALAAAGLFSAFYGVAIGITQSNPKTLLAFSSVSQMGVIAAVLGMVLAAGDGGVALSVGFYAAHHTLVKGALFLAVGVAQTTGARRLWPVLLPAAADRRGACEAGREAGPGRGHRRPACRALFGRDHTPDAPLPAPPCGDIGARRTAGWGVPADLAVARHGVRLRRGSLGALSDRHGRRAFRRLRSRFPLVGGLAGSAGRRTGGRSLAMGRQPAGGSRGGRRGAGGRGRQGPRPCHGLDAGAAGRHAAAVAGRRRVPTGGRGRSGRTDADRALTLMRGGGTNSHRATGAG
jgi:NADH:ubiquinone oxidoreductase subunit 2 (subunit N)